MTARAARPSRPLIVIGIASGIALAGAGAWAFLPSAFIVQAAENRAKSSALARAGAVPSRVLAAHYVVSPAALVAVAPDRARDINADMPFKALGTAARPLYITQAGARMTATDCLARAVYYEARSEPLSGQRAVAQVVLNRVRHPAFPSTVCGVVYQGSERTTGCQFTFTCDGSQSMKPSGQRWGEARKLAALALNGFVARDVGWATHYHADYVVPYWASDLDKIAAIGRHVFYRWSRGWGTAPAFKQQYVAAELDPMADIRVEIADAATAVAPALALASVAVRRNTTPLRADEASRIEASVRQRLSIDEAAPQLREELRTNSRLKVDEGHKP